jgi:hypothetical protein
MDTRKGEEEPPEVPPKNGYDKEFGERNGVQQANPSTSGLSRKQKLKLMSVKKVVPEPFSTENLKVSC